MAERKGWTPGKIVLVIVAGVVVLGLAFCAVLGIVLRDYIKTAVHSVKGMTQLTATMQKHLGGKIAVTMLPNDRNESVLLLGVEEELTPERVVELQDLYWREYAANFAEGGFAVKHVAIGRRTAKGLVSDWAKNSIPIEEVAARTGVPVPPVDPNLKVFDQSDSGSPSVEVRFGHDEEDDEPADEGGEDR